jgi:hypothetical protein
MEVMEAEFPEEDYHTTEEHPAAIIVDIATDPNGSCLEIGTGNPLQIYVLVEVDGVLKVASGVTFSYYEFEQPLSSGRLTDSDWRGMLAIELNKNGEYVYDQSVVYPEWYSDYVITEDWRHNIGHGNN